MINGVGKMTWEGIITDPLGGRVMSKPRKSGKTVISDLGYGLSEVSDFLANCGQYIDRAKLAFGTSVLYSEDYLKEKIRLYRRAEINVNPGGTCAEIAIHQGVYDSWLARAKELGFTTVEISDGTVPMDQALRERVIVKALEAGLEVVSEVGKKDEKAQLTLEQTIEQVKRDAALGVTSITVEARGTAKGIGVYGADGKVKANDVDAILNAVAAPEILVWEAPMKDGQEFFIKYLGNNVNLGNVRYYDVIALEGLRRGLRGDTLRMAIAQQSPRKG